MISNSSSPPHRAVGYTYGGDVMPTVIHVNQHVLRSNRKTGAREPALTLKRGRHGRSVPVHEAVARDRDGHEVFRVVYRPDDPLPCGAVCWVETSLTVTPLYHQEDPMSASKPNGTATKAKDAPKAPAKVKQVTHEITLIVKAPSDLPVSRVQRAVQAVFEAGQENIEVVIGDLKVIEDLDKMTLGKTRVVKKPVPTSVEDQKATETPAPAPAPAPAPSQG